MKRLIGFPLVLILAFVLSPYYWGYSDDGAGDPVPNEELEGGAITVSVGKYYMVGETGITITASIADGESGVSVSFSSSSFSPSSGTATTNSSGVATWNVSAVNTPSSSVNGSSVTASYTPPEGESKSDTKNFSVVDLSISSEKSMILVGGYSDDSIYSSLFTATANPPVEGVSVAFEFVNNSGRGVDFHCALESPDSTTDSEGKAKVRMRSSDLRSSPTVRVKSRNVQKDQGITIAGITSVGKGN